MTCMTVREQRTKQVFELCSKIQCARLGLVGEKEHASGRKACPVGAGHPEQLAAEGDHMAAPS